jgi:hypothetical protein
VGLTSSPRQVRAPQEPPSHGHVPNRSAGLCYSRSPWSSCLDVLICCEGGCCLSGREEVDPCIPSLPRPNREAKFGFGHDAIIFTPSPIHRNLPSHRISFDFGKPSLLFPVCLAPTCMILRFRSAASTNSSVSTPPSSPSNCADSPHNHGWPTLQTPLPGSPSYPRRPRRRSGAPPVSHRAAC